MGLHIHALDTYRPRASLIHRLDARVKLALAVFFIVDAALVPDGAWAAFGLLTALAWAAVLLSRLGMLSVQRRSLIALPFALAAVTIIFTTPGRPVLRLSVLGWPVSVSDAGLTRFVSVLLKSYLSVQMAVLLTGATPFPDLLRAMRSLGLPKVLVATVGFTYRYAFVIGDEAVRMLRARAARSGSPDGVGGGSLFWRARVAGGMVGSLFLRSIERSERIYAAMLARGYDGEARALRAPSLHRRDLLTAVPFALVMVAVQVVARGGWR